ncbi:protein SSUH2 homolog [Pyxicephalus adspersus]|uniref:protein SSUH2 homolog n=1 Tax=Pyxicephalus adspersus TaxID=30357 RepID=UPI003B5A6674
MSTEDFQTCRSVDSNPSTILPSSDMMEVVHLDDDRSSTSIADPKSQEIAPGNDTIIIEPDDSSNRFPLPETPQYPSPQCIPLTINLEQLFITEETAREALLSFGKTRPYYSSAAAEEMKFLDLLPSNTFRYSLETFAEFRVCQRKTEPYYNCEVDGPENGPPPHPWSIMVEPPVMFKEGNHRRKLPHTSSVKSCWKCNGSGKTNCDICYGTHLLVIYNNAQVIILESSDPS